MINRGYEVRVLALTGLRSPEAVCQAGLSLWCTTSLYTVPYGTVGASAWVWVEIVELYRLDRRLEKANLYT